MSEADHGKVLVVDDQYAADSGNYFRRDDFLREFGALPFDFVFSTAQVGLGAYTVEMALRAVGHHQPDALLLDIQFGEDDATARLGMDILIHLLRTQPALPVVMMTSLSKADAWEECARLGAVDYLPKPLDARRLWQTLDRYVGVAPEYWLLGQATGFLEAVMSAAQASEGGRTSVMISGETGTGKEVLARYIGRHGARASKPFVPIHIAPMQPEQQQAELFGAKKGSYTGATQDRQGYFAVANQGVAFLDEIGDIELRTQVNLLRVAESGEIAPLGETKPRCVDVQIVSATNANLARKVKDGEFRQDLWERLRGTAIHLPPLAQRVEDIPLLVRHLLRVEALARSKPVPSLPESVEARLLDLAWPGNVRALAKYAGRVFDVAGRAESPSEADFLEALPSADPISLPVAGNTTPANVTPAVPTAFSGGGIPEAKPGLQALRLEEMGLLHQAVLETRHRVTGALDRASAAALLKGKQKCSTNEFDRWLMSLWKALDKEHRAIAEVRFPVLMDVIRKHGEKSDKEAP